MTNFALHSGTDMRTPSLGAPGARRLATPDPAASHEGAAVGRPAPCPPAAIVILAPLLGVCLWAALVYATF